MRPNQAHPNRARLLGDYGRLPLHFEENRGQTDAQVRFLSRGAGYALFLTRDEAVLQLRKAEPRSRNDDRQSPSRPQSATLRLKLLGANPEPRITGFNQLPGKANYLIGSDPSQWRANIPTYAKVHYRNVYAGVDLVYYGNQRQLEHDFVVAPGADPKQIRLAVEGAERLELDAQGDAVLRVGDGEVRLRAPLAYQEINGRRQPVAARYALREGNPRPVPMQSGSEIRNPQSEELAFELGAYDPALPLVIDPVLVYSTYLGGSGNDIANGIAVDSDGNAYIAGQTLLADFPTNPLNARLGPTNTPGALDVFVAKLNYTGSSLMFSTYLGGSGDDVGTGIALNSSGSAYVTGSTMSTDFPTTLGAYQSPNPGGQDAFVTKLAPDGSALVYSVRLGGGSIDVGRGIAVDSNGNAYVTGETFSTNFPTWNASQTSNGAVWDAFVTKLNPAGSALLYSTYLGGNADDMGRGIAVDTLGNAYVTGDTRSTDFPTTPGALQTAGVGYDAFVTKLSAAGSRVYSTYLGGNSTDYGRGIAVDSNGYAYVTGLTASTNFPTLSAFQGSLGSNLSTCSGNDCFDAFAAKLNTTGSALVYSTFLGGAAYDGGNSIAVDSSGNAYVAGATASTDFPTAGAYQ
ncbi:MAG: SBBP repeat-containing protein, partial [Acidobacteria bacterium]|nr:SBBP repeat-containing protein [Acidobacteriota bacterium]